MDSFGDSQPTQATQNVVDPRRLGQQNSGFSDQDISDIICLLVPYSETARKEVARIATENSQLTLGRDETCELAVDYSLEDDAQNFGLVQQERGDHHIALRFSANVKNPVQGFTFGRNASKCDICFQNDPFRRLSNIHFRIYFNEWAVLMIEDMSTNGTIVDDNLLKPKSNRGSKRTLTSGSKIKILLHQGGQDLIFLVRIPLLQGEARAAYQRNLDAYMENQARLAVDANATIVPGPGGHVDLFKAPAPRRAVPARVDAQPQEVEKRPPGPARLDSVLNTWPGSDKYNRVGEVGRGAFATVYMVTSKFNGSPYAAKELDKRKFMKNGILDQKVENEMRIMQQIEHPNIVRYIEHLDWNDRLLIIIMEYIPGGDLGKLILERGPLRETSVQTMARQLLDALRYLHNKNITHRDVKPDNILVQSLDPFVTKLTDFGLSKMVESEDTFLRTFCGTLLYCAPEVYSEYHEYNDQGHRVQRNRAYRPPPGQRYGHAVDVWSLGGVLFYSLTKKPPFPAKSGAGHSELLHSIMTKPLDITPLRQAGVSNEGIDFLSRMLDRRPESRATVEELFQHTWVGGPGFGADPSTSQSFDEVDEDEELRIEASQLSLKDSAKEAARQARDDDELIPASDDEILDDEDVNDENHFSGYESEKENYTFGAGNQPQRLFGEVNVSAVGSSGAIPAERLNLPFSAGSLGGVTEIRDSFDSDLSTTPRPTSRKSQPRSDDQSPFASQSKSVNALNNMTFDVESQSLGGAESILEHLNMKSRAASVLLRPDTLNTSKRKSSMDLAADSDEQPPPEGRELKRIRSTGPPPDVPGLPVNPDDYELFACMVPLARGQSTRHQIDTPMHKSVFWIAQDKKTWHLRYPEMTHAQYDAFKAGAASRNETFGPGKSPLWGLAMKYFPPTTDKRPDNRTQSNGLSDCSTLQGTEIIPSTLQEAKADPDVIPDTQLREVRRPIPAPAAEWEKLVVACFRSARGSAVSDISALVTESMISWGRAHDNTRVYAERAETRVPKYGFKVLLWREGYDPYRDVRPWNRREFQEDGFHFYISTKATSGIWINGVHLPSHDHKNPNGPCRHWMRLYDEDSVVVWSPAGGSEKTELTFNCDWGDSAQPRSPWSIPTLVDEAIANRLDEICSRTEKKMRNLTEHDLKMEEADHDHTARMANMARERDRSRIFELARVEASRGGRRVSPSGRGGNAWAGHVPGNRMIPTFRSSSPTMSEMLRAARGG
ncbi:hypothetical protein V8F06_002339 [Rhypophila decipiens]